MPSSQLQGMEFWRAFRTNDDWNTNTGTENKDGEDAGAWGVWFNRVYICGWQRLESKTVYFPRSCLHCDEPAFFGRQRSSYKRKRRNSASQSRHLHCKKLCSGALRSKTMRPMAMKNARFVSIKFIMKILRN